MTRTEALADADREISRLIQDGRGLFYIAELYGVPVRRHSSRWFDSMDRAHLALPAWLQGQPGTLTLGYLQACLLYTSPSPRDGLLSRMPSSA